MVVPGLLPDTPDARPSRLKWILALAASGFALLVIAAAALLARLVRERDQAQSRVDELLSQMKRPVPTEPAPPPAAPELEQRLQELEGRLTRIEAARSADTGASRPPRAPDARIARDEPGLSVSESLAAGLRSFRTARYEAAERQFHAAVPDAYVYLLLSNLARGDLRYARFYLGAAIEGDPKWLRRVKPRLLFGTEAEYLRVVTELERRVAENPLDSEAKTLLAYLYYHEKGPEYAKALLIEASTADPANAEARKFLEALGP
jgi:hypothetical protein